MKPVVSRVQAELLRVLLRLLTENGPAAGADKAREMPSIIVESICSTDWSSLTFTGQRHYVTLRLVLPAPEATRLTERLVTGGARMSRHIVADIRVVDSRLGSDGLTMTIEVLTVDDTA